jgi:trans-AT polyketide synthase/acyltransferase/oxidoreductase domain-containing protein
MRGTEDEKVNYQVHCGPALGSFNQWVKGTELESWRNRHVSDIGERIMKGAAAVLAKRYAEIAPDNGEIAGRHLAASTVGYNTSNDLAAVQQKV